MLVVLEFCSASELSEYLHVVTWKNDEQNEEMEYCLGREKAQEVIACRDLGIPYVVLKNLSFISSRSATVDDQIIDTNVDINDLSLNTQLVNRAGTRRFDHPVLRQLKPFVCEQFTQNVAHWPTTIAEPEKYLKRQVSEMSSHQFNAEMRAGNIPLPTFLKGVEKGGAFSLRHVLSNEDELHTLVKTAGELRSIAGHAVPDHLNDDDYVAFLQMQDWECPYRGWQKGRLYVHDLKRGVILSEVLAFNHASDHKAEYRCFVIDGKVSSISTYTDYTTHPVPAEIRKLAEEFAADHADLAKGFVADFGMTDRGPVLVELNDFTKSGRYLGNDAYALYKDLEAVLGSDKTCLKSPDVPIPSLLQLNSFGEFTSKDSREFAMRLEMCKAAEVDQDEHGLG
jgi:hypothetical protein